MPDEKEIVRLANEVTALALVLMRAEAVHDAALNSCRETDEWVSDARRRLSKAQQGLLAALNPET